MFSLFLRICDGFMAFLTKLLRHLGVRSTPPHRFVLLPTFLAQLFCDTVLGDYVSLCECP